MMFLIEDRVIVPMPPNALVEGIVELVTKDGDGSVATVKVDTIPEKIIHINVDQLALKNTAANLERTKTAIEKAKENLQTAKRWRDSSLGTLEWNARYNEVVAVENRIIELEYRQRYMFNLAEKIETKNTR